MTQIIGAYGGYRKTFAFGYTCLVYHATCAFCRRNYDRTNDALGKTAGQMVGARVARAANLRLTSTLAETLLGVALISLVAMLPCLGVLAALLVAAWGLGAVVLTRLGTRAYLPTPLPPRPEGDTAEASRGGTHPLEALPGDESGGTAE